jgi:lysylphosphatidylglycerol synthetase-like protein (DUF2156 family)
MLKKLLVVSAYLLSCVTGNGKSVDKCVLIVVLQVSFLVNLSCVHVDIGWRISLGLQCVFAIILILGMFVLPESPRSVTVLLNLHVTSIPGILLNAITGGWCSKAWIIKQSVYWNGYV